jgi:hypothetical protein
VAVEVTRSLLQHPSTKLELPWEPPSWNDLHQDPKGQRRSCSRKTQACLDQLQLVQQSCRELKIVTTGLVQFLGSKHHSTTSRNRCQLYRLNTPCTETWEMMRLQ